LSRSRIARTLLTALAAAAALYAIATFWRQHARAAGLDFYIYFVAGQLAGRADVDNIYGPEVQARLGEEYFARAQASGSELRKFDAQRRRRLDLVSSPFLYTTMRWVSRDYDRALTQIHIYIFALFMAGVLLFCRAVGLSWASALFLLAALLLWYRGFEADFRVGNVNSMQLAALGVFLWMHRRVESWVLLGALLLFKPNLMFVPLLLAVARIAAGEWRRLAKEMVAAIGGALAALVIGSISYGSPRVWLQWIEAAGEFYGRLQTRSERNVAPALALFEQYGEWVSYVIAAILVAIVCVAIRRRRGGDPALLIGLGILIYLLGANVVWLHYMVLVIPIAVALMRWRGTAVVALISLALIAEEPFEILTGKAAFPVEVMLITPAFVALFACGVWKLGVRRELSRVRP
jgi:hypothetical protein